MVLPIGPLLPEEFDVAMIPLRLRNELTINLSGEAKHFVNTYYSIVIAKRFPQSSVLLQIFSTVLMAVSTSSQKVHSVRKFYRRNFSLVINKEGHRINMES